MICTTCIYAHLLEGIVRWNQDRAVVAVEDFRAPRSHMYSSALHHKVNGLNKLQYGKDLASYQVHRSESYL